MTIYFWKYIFNHIENVSVLEKTVSGRIKDNRSIIDIYLKNKSNNFNQFALVLIESIVGTCKAKFLFENSLSSSKW